MKRGRAALLAVAAGAALAGCGGSATDNRRHDVNAYIANVDRIERDAATEWRHVQSAYSHLGGSVSPQKMRELDAAPATIRAFRRRIAAVPPPPDAVPLRTALLRLLAADASLAVEVSEFGRYVTDVNPVERDVAAATRTLQSRLNRAPKPAAREETLAAYATALTALDARLGALRPPPALVPWDRAQHVRLRALRAGADALRGALAADDPAGEQQALGRLQGAAQQSYVTTADRAAIVAYDARLAGIGRLAAAVARAQTRLTREFT